mgnify:CR=1 FL=1
MLFKYHFFRQFSLLHIPTDMNEYSEEQASMLRLNMAIVEERTCQWSLYQRSLRDFDDSVLDEGNMKEFDNLMEAYSSVANYIEQYQKITEIEDKENISEISRLLKKISKSIFGTIKFWQH